jgi:hypothetical protein
MMEISGIAPGSEPSISELSISELSISFSLL